MDQRDGFAGNLVFLLGIRANMSCQKVLSDASL